MRLSNVTSVALPAGALERTGDVLRRFGEHGAEGLVLWTGAVDGERAVVNGVLVPDQNPIRSESGVGYFVEGPALFRLAKYLSDKNTRLIAQVHSHPTEAYHSSTDDRYAIVTEEGGLSLVVPDFARAPMTLETCAIYRLCGGEWLELSPESVSATFHVS